MLSAPSEGGCGDRQHFRDLGMLQVDRGGSQLLPNARQFLLPALRPQEKRVILDHGGIDYSQDDQNLPISLSRAGLQLVLPPMSPGLAWGPSPPPPGTSQQRCNHREQQLGCSGSSSSANSAVCPTRQPFIALSTAPSKHYGSLRV